VLDGGGESGGVGAKERAAEQGMAAHPPATATSVSCEALVQPQFATTTC
jgi:hypothetical protein